MKKYLVIFVALLIVSCSKNDDVKNPTVSERIIGDWNGVESELVFFAPTGNQTVRQDLSYLKINFAEDGTFISDSLNIPLDSGLWSVPDVSTFVLDSLTFNIVVLSGTHFYFQIDSSIVQGSTTINVSQTTKLAK